MEFRHYSVLRDETIENLNIRPDGIYVDGTLGGAGHSYEIAKRLSDKGRLIGIDQDADAIKAAGERLAEFGDRVTIVRSRMCFIHSALKRWMVLCWILEFHPSSLTHQKGVLPTGVRMHRLICVWTTEMSLLQGI